MRFRANKPVLGPYYIKRGDPLAAGLLVVLGGLALGAVIGLILTYWASQ